MRELKLTDKREKDARIIAPLAGAWIETRYISREELNDESHPSRVRELKQCDCFTVLNDFIAPLAGAWIETWRKRLLVMQAVSHPSRVRELKLPAL